MSLEAAFEIGRLLRPLTLIAGGMQAAQSQFLLLPGLRSFWPLGPASGTPEIIDMTGGNHLAFSGTPTINTSTGAPYVAFTSANSDYLLKSPAPDLNITGSETFIDPALRGLTVGGWFWFNSTGADVRVIGKQPDSAFVADHAYGLIRFNTSTIAFQVTTGVTTYQATQDEPQLNSWNFIVGRYTPSTEVAVVVNGTKVVNTTSIPPVINTTVLDFTVGASATPGRFMDGRASLCFACATALPDHTLDTIFAATRQLYP